jgi:transcriptional regulator with XRE-family HTH domain
MPKTRPDFEAQHAEDIRKIAELEKENAQLKEELNGYKREAKRVQELKDEYQAILAEEYWKPVNNERGAGRKPKLNDELTTKVIALHKKGMTQREISIRLGVSVGLVNKACNIRNMSIDDMDEYVKWSVSQIVVNMSKLSRKYWNEEDMKDICYLSGIGNEWKDNFTRESKEELSIRAANKYGLVLK